MVFLFLNGEKACVSIIASAISKGKVIYLPLCFFWILRRESRVALNDEWTCSSKVAKINQSRHSEPSMIIVGEESRKKEKT